MSTREATAQASNAALAIQDSGFFVLRTPALPVHELVRWGESLRARQAYLEGGDETALSNAWASDLRFLRSRLIQIVDNPEVRHALFVASPSLESSIHYWKSDPESKRGRQTERSLVRYFSRMCARPMPFGLFAGCSTGRVAQDNADTTDLLLDSRGSYRLTCRLDFDYLFALTTALQADPAIAEGLRYWPNSSLRGIGDVWHYVESRLVGNNRSHHLVKLQRELILDAIIERAREGLSIQALVEITHRLPEGSEFSEEEIRGYIFELISNGVLVSSLTPLVSGQPALDDLISQLEMIPAASQAAECLRNVRDRMAALDRMGLGVAPVEYRGIASTLEQLSAKFDLAKLFQVDMVKPSSQLILSQQLLDELKAAIALLCRVGQSGEPNELRTFREAFLSRYERAWVPLEMVLDEESGIGFGSASGADSSPLLRNLGLGNRPTGPTADFQSLLKRAYDAAIVQNGGSEIVFDISDVPPRVVDHAFPSAFDVTTTLVSSSLDALRAGNFRIVIKGMAGPSGARLLGRFCHADRELEGFVRDHLHQEEQCEPDAVYAEIVHLPEGRFGNILCRPVFREYEIVYLGRSGAPPERQLPVSDLLVTVAPDGRILLYSKRLKKRVLPRLTNAHAYMNPTLASVYRFLAFLQHDGGGLPYFSWGDLGAMRTLPRVRIGGVVLACAQWRLSSNEVNTVVKKDGLDRFLAVQELRKQRRLPRWVVLIESDNSLPVDLDNPLSVDAFVHVLKRAGEGTLNEMYPAPDELCVTGPEGRFCHELLVPFVRSKTDKPADGASARATFQSAMKYVHVDVPRSNRSIAPGAEWLYLKAYAGPATLDEILTNTLPALLRTASAWSLISEWFFVRYSDPNLHLRLRFRGRPDRLWQELLPLISGALNPFISSGRVWKLQLDTYEREIERYGGPEGMALSEEIFNVDSDAALELLKSFEGDEGIDMRWRVALLAMDRLLKDFNIDLVGRKEAAQKMRDMYEREFGVAEAGRTQLGDKFRRERHTLEAMLANQEVNPAVIFAQQVLDRRSVRLAGTVKKLRALAETGQLKTDIGELVSSYNHMHVNRLLRMDQRAHEMVLYNFLHRLYEGESTRQGKKSPEVMSHVGRDSVVEQ